MTTCWSANTIGDPLYRAKFIDVPDIIGDWVAEHGGLSGKTLLEFGCGEGTMALGMALRKDPLRIVGIDVSEAHRRCLAIAQQQIGLDALPDLLEFHRIAPGQEVAAFGPFDFAYSWSVFEHVAQDFLAIALASIRAALKPGGYFFLQISPLYYSANGSHLAPWVPAPWAHLSMQQDRFHQALLAAGTTAAAVRAEWSAYIPPNADTVTERSLLWETFVTLNRITAPQLCRLLDRGGFDIVRDYRTSCDAPIPPCLAEVYRADILLTEQIVLLARRR